MKRLSLLSTVFALGFVATAAATPVSVQWDGATNGSATNGGPFNVVLTSSPGGNAIADFVAWCFELTEFINPIQAPNSGLYEMTTSPVGISDPSVSATQAGNLAQLFEYYNTFAPGAAFAGSVSATTAMQAAIWTEIYGSGYAGGASGVNMTERQAGVDFRNNALNDVSITGNGIRLTYLVADGQTVDGQVMGNFQDLIVAEVVPLPAGVWLLLGGIGAFVAVRRRQTSAA